MANLNFDEERILNTPIILYVDYISLHYKNYLKNNYPDVSLRDFTYIVNIFYHKNISQRELSELLFVSEANVTQIIKKLEKKELIIRIPDENNKSRKILHITKKAEDILFSLLKEIYKWENKFFDNYSEEDIKKFKKMIYDYSDKSINP